MNLRKEGIARELINRIQNIRKDSGFEVQIKFNSQLKKMPLLKEAVSENEAYIKRETLTKLIRVYSINPSRVWKLNLMT